MPGGFNRRVASLNGLVGRRQIRADKQIDVSRLDLRNLRETGIHERSPVKVTRNNSRKVFMAKAMPPRGAGLAGPVS